MGGMYSVLWLMALVFQAICRTLACTPELRSFKLANLREVRLSGVGLRSSEGVIIVHVDDIAACHQQQQLANLSQLLLQKAQTSFEAVGLVAFVWIGRKLRRLLGIWIWLLTLTVHRLGRPKLRQTEDSKEQNQ